MALTVWEKMQKNMDLFRNETDYPSLDLKLAVEHLRQAIRFQTVNHLDTTRTDFSQFEGLHAFLEKSYPLIAKFADWKIIGYSLLIVLPGSNPNLKPAMFIAHQDVVPVLDETVGNWEHAPFSGDLSNGFIWGRGAMDIKEMLIGEMEAVEYLLNQGTFPERTMILAFGEDEETQSHGAIAIAAELKKRGVEPEFILDEGAGNVSDAADWGAPGELICPIGIYEKGYADLHLSIHSQGGHSSNPFGGTSLGKMAEAITTILHHMPEPYLSDSIRSSLKLLLPVISEEPMKTWARDPDYFKEEIMKWFDCRESLYHLIRTTAAPTMISPGAPSGNVMPQDMDAVINFRLIPKDTPEKLMNTFHSILSEEVHLEWEQQISASRPSQIDGLGFLCLKETLEHYFDRLIFLPAQNRGATDARQYEELCKCVMRFGPFLEEEDISAEGIHGTNERISVRAYAQGIRVLIRLMEKTCMESGVET